MTLRISTTGKSLSKVFHVKKAQLQWVGKLHKNCRKLLDRLGDIVTMTPQSLASTKSITLLYSGNSEDLARIERVLDTRFVDGMANVKFSRITVNVKLTVAAAKKAA